MRADPCCPEYAPPVRDHMKACITWIQEAEDVCVMVGTRLGSGERYLGGPGRHTCLRKDQYLSDWDAYGLRNET